MEIKLRNLKDFKRDLVCNDMQLLLMDSDGAFYIGEIDRDGEFSCHHDYFEATKITHVAVLEKARD